MSPSTNIILDERTEEQNAVAMPPSPSVRAVQSVGSLVVLFFLVQGVVDYFVLRLLSEIVGAGCGVGDGGGVGVGVGQVTFNETGG